jgi:adenylyltransferase/sulfurtransferase
MAASVSDGIDCEIESLKKRLAELELLRDQSTGQHPPAEPSPSSTDARPLPWDNTVAHGLSKSTIERFSRQIILPSFGVASQSKLHNGSVLVVGAGGLGSPALLYLASAGVGRIGIVDRDEVELSNIHRQIIHRESCVGAPKTASAKATLRALNSSVVIEEHPDGFTPSNAIQLVQNYDVVLDASDNAPTRYLISDACCVANKPLVSGAAIGTDGQLTVYHHGDDGPCYRCLYPTPPPAASCARCADAGVLGPVPGIIGTMQALEVIKILSGIGEVFSKRMLVMDALYCRYMVVKLRSRSEACVACGKNPEITRETLPGFDYNRFTGQAASDAPTALHLVDSSERICVSDLVRRMDKGDTHLLLDVRPAHQFDICSLPGAVNVPLSCLDANHIKEMVREQGFDAVSVICRRGNQSQRALLELKAVGVDAVDVIGGMQAWSEHIDPGCPIY